MGADAAAPAGRRLILVRHGQTAWNAEGRAQGHADVSLDDTGRSQAEEMAPVVAAYDPALLASSDLARARETAAYVEKATGLTCEEDQRLREYDLGSRTGLAGAEFRAASTDDSESDEDVAARVVPALREVLDRLGAGESAVVVLHGAALRIAVAGLLDWPLAAADALATLDNCAWAVLTRSPRGRLRLTAYNLTAQG